MPKNENHPDQVALSNFIMDKPEDDARWLVWADWWEDHGDVNVAAHLRKNFRTLQRFWLARLGGSSGDRNRGR